jgi:hypothetical protein
VLDPATFFTAAVAVSYMTNDFGTDFASELTDYFVDGTDIPAAEATYYVTLYDDTGSELNGSLQNGRVAVGTADWTETATTAFENASEINFGEVTGTADITVQEFAIKDTDATDANARELVRAPITDAPQDFAPDTRVFFAVGDLDVDILD